MIPDRVFGHRWAALAAIACGIVALAARSTPSLSAVAVTFGVGIIGALAPVPPAAGRAATPAGRTVVVFTVGCVAFALARWLQRGAPIPFTLVALVVSAGAGIAEELFFRKLVYGWLAPWAIVVAIGGTAALFAMVHVPAYGLIAVPVDLAAGVVFGWQRWASGGWAAPALTHAFANMLQFLH